MTAPATVDLDALWDLEAALVASGPGRGLPRPLLEGLREVFRADHLDCRMLDPRSRRHVFRQESSADSWLEHGPSRAGDPWEDTFWRLYWSSFCSHADRHPEVVSARRISDFYPTTRSWHATPIYATCLQDDGVEHGMYLGLEAPRSGRSVRIVMWREDGPDFGDRDKFLLELLRPHLRSAWRRCETARHGATLTERQQAVLRLVREGSTNVAIGRQLGISEGTVRTHLQNAYAVLGVSSRTAAVTAAALD